METYQAMIGGVGYFEARAESERAARAKMVAALIWRRAEGLLSRWHREGAEVKRISRSRRSKGGYQYRGDREGGAES